jgi:hypothetical protein
MSLIGTTALNYPVIRIALLILSEEFISGPAFSGSGMGFES